jgi:exodeoxyribonuclease V gamma subunit
MHERLWGYLTWSACIVAGLYYFRYAGLTLTDNIRLMFTELIALKTTPFPSTGGELRTISSQSIPLARKCRVGFETRSYRGKTKNPTHKRDQITTMPGFNLITSNRLEHLVTLLAQSVSRPLESPLAPEIVIVQNRGMERLLSLRLSEELGIWANCCYPFPSAYIQSLFKAADPDLPERLMFDQMYLPFRILQILPHCFEMEVYSEIAEYLKSGQSNGLFDLALKIADQFDRYTVYRPSMVERWSGGEDTHWQADLWRRLNTGEKDHRVQIKRQFFERLLKRTLPGGILPERLSIFGVSTLPPFHTGILNALATEISIDCYLLNPCAEFWDDILPERQITKKLNLLKKRKRSVTPDEQHFETGNPLLASLGKYGQEFIQRLHSMEIEESAVMSDSGIDTMLHAVQSDILHLRSRPDQDNPKIEITPADRSIQLHSTHSVMREVEILYDQLLAMFQTLTDLTPSDVVVMAPDINEYASAVDAVFGSNDPGETRIPYSMADRAGQSFCRIRTLFKLLLSIPQSRFSVGVITELLDFEEIRRAFSLNVEDCDTISQWITGTGIKWSIDGVSKQQFDCPPYEQNTWMHGLDQLLLGFALPTEQSRPFADLYGYEHIEGTMAAVLGNFLCFFNTLTEFDSICTCEHTLTEWSEILCSYIDQCIAPDDLQQQDITQVRGFIMQFVHIQTAVNFDEPVNFDLVKRILVENLDSQVSDQAFFNGGVTFCSMLPMRGIPFRVVCCIGMGDSAFPRKSSATSWDLIAADPQPGDRSIEKEDRFLFLEALLSARDIFYVSFIKDPREKNSSERQSVLVDELIDYCEHAFFLTNNTGNGSQTTQAVETGAIAEHLVTRHRLQGFNQSYFDESDPCLFSYSKENLDSATALISPKLLPKPIFEHSLSEPQNSSKTIVIQDLIRFFSGPSEYLLSQRLGVGLSKNTIEIDELEPFDIKGLEKYHLANSLIDTTLRSGEMEPFLKRESSRGTLPHGTTGDFYSWSIVQEVTPFIEKLKAAGSTYSPGECSCTLTVGEYTLTGSLQGVCDRGVFHHYYSKNKATFHLRLWITHCLLMLYKRLDSIDSLLICRDDSWRYGPAADAEKVLQTLCDFYSDGLQQPLHFFPESSWAFAQSLLVKNKPIEESLMAASRVWFGNDFSKMAPEQQKPGNIIFFKELNPIDEQFADVSTAIFGPILKCLD